MPLIDDKTVISSYNLDNINFTDFNIGTMQFGGKLSSTLITQDSPSMKLLNAIDIDWDNAKLPYSNTIIKSSGSLLSFIDNLYNKIESVNNGYTLTNHEHSVYSLSEHQHNTYYTLTNHAHGNYYSMTDHEHSVYSLDSHEHNQFYSMTNHTHSAYSLDSHAHGNFYSLSTHGHSNYYSMTDHEHGNYYSMTDHAHSVYSLNSHAHGNFYSLSTHGHDNYYSMTSHAHSIYSMIVNINSGNNGTHEHDNFYSLTSHQHNAYYSLTSHQHNAYYTLTNHSHDTYYDVRCNNLNSGIADNIVVKESQLKEIKDTEKLQYTYIIEANATLKLPKPTYHMGQSVVIVFKKAGATLSINSTTYKFSAFTDLFGNIQTSALMGATHPNTIKNATDGASSVTVTAVPFTENNKLYNDTASWMITSYTGSGLQVYNSTAGFTAPAIMQPHSISYDEAENVLYITTE